MASKIISIGVDKKDYFILYHIIPNQSVIHHNTFKIIIKMFDSSATLIDSATLDCIFTEKSEAKKIIKMMMNDSATPDDIRKMNCEMYKKRNCD